MNNTPAISPAARSAVYVGCLIVNVLAVVGFGIAAIFGWLPVEQATAAGGLLIAGVSIVSNGLSVGYRPTRGNGDETQGAETPQAEQQPRLTNDPAQRGATGAVWAGDANDAA